MKAVFFFPHLSNGRQLYAFFQVPRTCLVLCLSHLWCKFTLFQPCPSHIHCVLASASRLLLSYPILCQGKLVYAHTHLPHNTVPVQLHTALAWLPQWVSFSPYAGSLLSEHLGEVRVRDKQVWKSGGQWDPTVLLWKCLIFRSWQVAWSQRGDGGWGAEFLQRTTDALNHRAGPVILLRRVQMGKLNNSWVLRHPKSGQCGRRKPRGTEEGTGRCCWEEPVRSGPVITKPGAPRFVEWSWKSKVQAIQNCCRTYWVCALLQTKGPENNQ